MSEGGENSLQTLTRWLSGLLAVSALAIIAAVAVYAIGWILVGVVAAVVVMLKGIAQAIRPRDDKRRTKPLVSRLTLYLCFYLLAIPAAALVYLADTDYGLLAAAAIGVSIIYFVLRWFIHSGSNSEAALSATSADKKPGLSRKKAYPRRRKPSQRPGPRSTIFGYVEQFRGVPGLVGDTARRHIERSPKNDTKFAQRPPVNGRFEDGLFVLSGGGTSYEICPIVPDRPDLLLKILEL